jgi:hypothetical protein
MISQRCQACAGPLASSRTRWWEGGLPRITSRRSFRCAYCHKRCWIIPAGSEEQPPHSAQQIVIWPTLDLASLDSPPRFSGVTDERRQTPEVPRRQAGDVDCELIISITSASSTAAVTSLHMRRPRSSFRRSRRLNPSHSESFRETDQSVSDRRSFVEDADGLAVRIGCGHQRV